MSDKFDEQATDLVAHWRLAGTPVDSRLVAMIAEALRESGNDRMRGNCKKLSVGDSCDCGLCVRDKQIADLRAENERLKHELLVIGDMAVVNFDDAVVGAVDKTVPIPPKTYAEKRRAEIEQHKKLRDQRDRLCDRIDALDFEVTELKEEVDRLKIVLKAAHESNLYYQERLSKLAEQPD